MNEIDEKIQNIVDELEGKGLKTERSLVEGTATYVLVNNALKIKITINPERWLGLELTIYDENVKEALNYAVDTDLYNISDKKHMEFAEQIGFQIVEILNGLLTGKVMVGRIKNHKAMVLPVPAGYVRVVKGWFFSTSRTFKDINQATDKGNFKTLQV